MGYSEASKQRNDTERAALEEELEKYRHLVRNILKSNESKLLKTQKQRQYHSKICELQRKLEHMGG
jgi:hypothetical protein